MHNQYSYEYEYEYEYNNFGDNNDWITTLKGIMMLFGIFPIALLFSCIVVSSANKFFFESQYVNTEDEDSILKIENYITRYPIDDIVNNEEENEDYIVNPNSYIMDYTPDGIVMLKYDYDEEGFLYWANKKNVPYSILETVARKYVKQYCCKNLYIDRKELLEEKKRIYDEKKKQLEEQEAMKQEDKTVDDSNDDSSENSVFASFKSYNTGSKDGSSKRPRTSSKEQLNVCERSNKFIRKGSINEFEFTQQSIHEVVDTRPKLDFETFKRLFAQQDKRETIELEQCDNVVETNDLSTSSEFGFKDDDQKKDD